MKFLMGIDPGEEKCGVAILLTDVGNAEAELIAGLRPRVQDLGDIIEKWHSDTTANLFIAYEQYRVYNSKLKSHRFSRVQTIEAIGMLEYLINKYKIAHKKFMAGTWKQVVTDVRLKELGFWGEYNSTDARHIRDATGISVYAWKYAGVFNENRRVLTEADKEKLAKL